jgi:hypothetical protein
MKRNVALALIVALGSLAHAACAGGVVHRRTVVTTVSHYPPGAGVAVEMFYDDLAPFGAWVRVEGPGWVWRPAGLPVGWRPYTLGHWVYTEHGWTWVSEEQWGWAVYHYGRWHHAAAHGWVWVPGTDWGPAWVTWHSGAGWIGWAPLPWQVSWNAGVGLDWGRVDVRVAIKPAWWCFVPTRRLADPTPARHFAPAGRVPSLVRITNNVTNYTVIDNRVFNPGVHVNIVSKAAGRPVPHLRVRETGTPRAAAAPAVQGDEVLVFRPAGRAGRQPGVAPARSPQADREAPARPAGRVRAPQPPERPRPVRPTPPSHGDDDAGQDDAVPQEDEASQDRSPREEAPARKDGRGPRVPEPPRSGAVQQPGTRPAPGAAAAAPGAPAAPRGGSAAPRGAAAAPAGGVAAPANPKDDAGPARDQAERGRPRTAAPTAERQKPGAPAGKKAGPAPRKPAKKDDSKPAKKSGAAPADDQAEGADGGDGGGDGE